MKVLVCDDDEDQCMSNVDAIRDLRIPDVHDVSDLHSGKLKAALTGFFNRIAGEPADTSDLDDSDIIILDNNLSHLQIAGARLTAETIAGYIRAYSASSPYIVSLNKNPEVDFDLRYLVGDYSTIADLAINNDHLSNKALWTGDPADARAGFLPWYWPCLHSQPERRRIQIENVRKNLDNPIFATLGITSDVANYISRHATGTLSPEAPYEEIGATKPKQGEAIHEISFRDFFLRRNRSLPDNKERTSLSDGAPRDADTNENHDIISRAIAADVDLWVRRDLIAPQDALVDLPHLLVRMPFLLGSRLDDIENWNWPSSTPDNSFGLDSSLYKTHLEHARVNDLIWGSTPTFLWPRLQDNGELNKMSFDAAISWPDVVFCEDRSSFVAMDSKADNQPARFEAEFEGAWTRRYVSRISKIKYAPRSRFAQ